MVNTVKTLHAYPVSRPNVVQVKPRSNIPPRRYYIFKLHVIILGGKYCLIPINEHTKTAYAFAEHLGCRLGRKQVPMSLEISVYQFFGRSNRIFNIQTPNFVYMYTNVCTSSTAKVSIQKHL